MSYATPRPRIGSFLIPLVPLVALLLVTLSACNQATSEPPDDEHFETVQQEVSAAEGGVIDIPGGASLEIPPGALAEDTVITVGVPKEPEDVLAYRLYRLEPEGLTFSTPATLTMPFELAEGLDPTEAQGPNLGVFLLSENNEPQDAGSEISYLQPARVLAVDMEAGTLDVELEHFSFIYAYRQIDGLAYVVMDIPPKFLEPADLLFTLTRTELPLGPDADGPNWAPGHVGLFAPRAGRSVDTRVGRIVEATPPQVAPNTMDGFKTEPGHIFMGARRPSGGLNGAEQGQVLAFAEDQIGKEYAAILGQGNITEGAFSCVGLAESALEAADKGVLNVGQEALVSTPLEMFWRTEPVREITVYVGEEIDVPIYGVVVDPDSFKVLEWWFSYYCVCEFTLSAMTLPEGAGFTGPQPLGHGGDGAQGYLFSWTPEEEHAGQTFTASFQMLATIGWPVFPEEVGLIDELRINVLPLSGETVTGVRLDHPLGGLFQAGEFIELDRITGHRITEGESGCSDGAPHLHAEGEGIYIDGAGPFDDPNAGGCGYGQIEDVPVEHLR